jgi:hypothetical protein
MTDPFFGPTPTPTSYTYNYSRGGSPYYGDKTQGLFGFAGLPERTSLLKILRESDHVQLYGSHIGATTAENATAAAAVTTGIFTGVVVVGLAISYGLGRYVAAPIIEASSGKKLTVGQKRGVGIATMIL